MSRIDSATVQRILDAADIVDVVSQFVSLKRRGSGYVGLCPFHNERTPSFSVSPSRGICKCFSCGKGGSPVNFIMELEKLSYQDALRWLAKRYNIEIEERELTDEERQAETERESMLAVNEWALKYFEKTLTENPDGRAIGLSYFRQRGVSDAMVKKFHLGYCTEERDAMYRAATSAGYTEKYLLSTGICAKTDQGRVYDRFKGRVIYPVMSIAGKVVAFGGRTLRSDKTMAKYVNSPESVIYSKSHQLYGLYQAKNVIQKADKVYLVEGYMDVISMYQSGVENVVASSGTSLTTGQIRLISRFTKNVTVIYDSDAAGIKASLRGIDLLLAENLDVKVLQFPEGDDPDSFAQNHTSEELVRYLSENEVDFIRFKTRILLSGVENDPIKRATVISDICKSIASIPDLIKRTVYIGETSRMLGIDEQVVALQVAKNAADMAEADRIERQREAGRKDLESFNRREQSTTQGAETVSGTTPTTIQEKPLHKESPQDEGENYLAPFEKEVMRYIIRYGMVSLNLISDDGTEPVKLSVLDFIKQEMALDDISFQYPAVLNTFRAADRLVRENWQRDHDSFLRSLESDIASWRATGEADIRNRLADIVNLGAEEAALEERISRRRHEAELEFECSYISKTLISSPEDDVRRLTTDLVSDKYILSNVHSRFTPLVPERDRLDELVERAIFEWKDAILDVNLKQINDDLTRICSSENADMAAIKELMASKSELLELKREFAKVLGERILTPRKLK